MLSALHRMIWRCFWKAAAAAWIAVLRRKVCGSIAVLRWCYFTSGARAVGESRRMHEWWVVARMCVGG